MNETILSAVVPVFGIALVGLAIRKLNWLTEEADQSLLRVNINLLLPCLILDSTLGNPALGRAGNLLLAPLVGFGTVGLGLALAWALRRLAGPMDERAGRTYAFSTGMYNYGYVPVPLTMLLFNNDTLGVLFVHNVGVEAALWTIGLMTLTGHRVGRDWRRILNAPLIAILVALVMNASDIAPHIPAAARTAVHLLGDCAIPMALILVGATIADELHEFRSGRGARIMATALVLRVGVLPMLFLLLAKYLPASAELKRVIVIQAAMGSAVLPIVLTKHYGGDTPTALRVVLGTSAASLVTIPLWIRFGLRFVGL